MADVEEPQFTSVSARIAALKQQQGFNKAPQPAAGKRPPPPPPPVNRPSIEPRSKTTNNPPISTYGSSVNKKTNNEPIGINGLELRPTPSSGQRRPPAQSQQSDRQSPSKIAFTEQQQWPSSSLPSRKASAPSPALPPRNLSAPIPNGRRGSNASTVSYSSTISGMSLSQGGSSTSSLASTDTQRKLPPALGDAKLPPLPPSRRDIEEKANAAKVSLVTTKSTPNILRGRPSAPELRPKLPPRMPSRPRTRLLEEEPRPVLPARPSRNDIEEEAPLPAPKRLPPPSVARSALSMGFNNKPTPKPIESPMPVQNQLQTYTPPAQVVELTPANFDRYVMSGSPALVDFYAPYCKYCKELDPIYVELAQNFGFAKDQLSIAKMDVDAHKSFENRFPDIQGYPTILFFDGSSEIPQKYQFMRDLESLTKFITQQTGLRPQPPSSNGAGDVPPLINKGSKPTFSQIQAVKARAVPVSAATPSGCLLCRDFSGPDSVAAQYPRQSLPRTADITGYLADVLCGPFSSATDKARAIFTWLHHNIAYDVDAFFGNRVKHVDPKDTISSGLAVCGGYAGVYVAIALKAGLECVMVTGHGKGYGYTALKPGEAVPPCKPSGHAWNAVRIDNGEWKLIDACWGAGNVGNQTYNKKFSPSCFTSSNEDFGLKHFPQDDAYFFRSDGRRLTWAEYFVGPVGSEGLQIYGVAEDHGLQITSFTPAAKVISTNSSEVVRFQFSKICEHWDHERNSQGKPYCMILSINGLDGRKEDHVAFESNEFWWWADVPARDLGCRGQSVSVFAVTTVNGSDARGMTRRDYLGKKGKCGMGFAGIAKWDLI